MLHAARSLTRSVIARAHFEPVHEATRARTLQAKGAGEFQVPREQRRRNNAKERRDRDKEDRARQAYEAQLARIVFSYEFLANHTANSEPVARDRTTERRGDWGHLNTVIDLRTTSLRNMREQIHGLYQRGGYPDQDNTIPVSAARWLFAVARGGRQALIQGTEYSADAGVRLKSYVSMNPFTIRVTGVAGEEID